MLIWRGWGVLAAVYTAVALMIFLGAASSVLPEWGLPLSAALGLLGAAAATWFTGQALNRTRPQRRLDEWYPARSAQLDQLVASGGFQLGPGQPLPASQAEARQQADWLLEQETTQLRASSLDRHTLFFVPMQYVAVLQAAVALLLLVIGVAGVINP